MGPPNIAIFTLIVITAIFTNSVRSSERLVNGSVIHDKKSIFILAGQSNMAGRGGVTYNKWDGILPPECQPNPNILRLNAKLGWEEAREPLHADIDIYGVCGVGPGMSFANAVRKMGLGIEKVGLVPCAVGGTNITEWSRGKFLYNQLLTRVKASLADGGTVRAILWYQGEADTIKREDAVAYKRKLERFFFDVRADLQSPKLPIIQVALASGQGPYLEIVRRAQLGLRVPNVWCVDGKGLKIGPDYVHLSTPAQAKLGQMLAQEFGKTL